MERFVRLAALFPGKELPIGGAVRSWENHYSLKYSRCYFLFHRSTGQKPDGSVAYVELYDPYERRRLASALDATQAVNETTRSWCFLEDHLDAGGHCDVVRTFVNDRMTH